MRKNNKQLHFFTDASTVDLLHKLASRYNASMTEVIKYLIWMEAGKRKFCKRPWFRFS